LSLLVIDEIHSCCIAKLIKFKINFRCGQNLMISTKINFIRVTVCRETKSIIIFVKKLNWLLFKMSQKKSREISFDDLKEHFECPVCLQVPLMFPIPQCENGHLVCKLCRKKLSHCPICRQPLGTSVSLLAETIINK
jgi:hypothetical protein